MIINSDHTNCVGEIVEPLISLNAQSRADDPTIHFE